MQFTKLAARGGFWSLALLLLACGSHNSLLDVCDCVPTAPASEDFRHNEKHVPLPNSTPQEITVATMLSWPQTPVPASDAPRSGRELQMFHISHAFVQLTFEVKSDCDIHMEISDTPDKTSPRAIVETPVDSEYCPARQVFEAQVFVHGTELANLFQQAELPKPLAVDITGLAFQDDPHSTRGSTLVGTVWELHPAIVKLTQ